MQNTLAKIVTIVVASLLCSNAYGDSLEEENVLQLDTVTVTAQKKEENVQEVPISMDVFSEMEMEY